MHIFLHKRISYRHQCAMHMHAAIFVYVRAAETAREAVCVFCQTQLMFVFDRKQFGEITIVREHKRV